MAILFCALILCIICTLFLVLAVDSLRERVLFVDNSGVFSHLKEIGYRKVLHEEPGWKRVEVQQVTEVRVLWMKRCTTHTLVVEEDESDPEFLNTKFELKDSVRRFIYYIYYLI